MLLLVNIANLEATRVGGLAIVLLLCYFHVFQRISMWIVCACKRAVCTRGHHHHHCHWRSHLKYFALNLLEEPSLLFLGTHPQWLTSFVFVKRIVIKDVFIERRAFVWLWFACTRGGLHVLLFLVYNKIVSYAYHDAKKC